MANTRKLKNNSGFLADFGQARIRNHLGLFVFTLLGIGATYLYEPTSQLNDIIAVGTGYVSLVLLVVTLAIGTLNLVLKRKNPVNVNFRRDAGIWCGITGVIHALVSFTLYNSGNILAYFLTKSSDGTYSADFNLNATSNLVGVLALVVMLALLLTSNNLSMRYLKGKSWKFVQRFNYLLFILTVAHTVGYLVLNLRESFFTFFLIALVIFTIIAQVVGIMITLRRENVQGSEASSSQLTKTPTFTEEDLAQNRLARRRFIILAGSTLVFGVGSSTALAAALIKQNTTPTTTATTVSSSPVANGTTRANNTSTSGMSGTAAAGSSTGTGVTAAATGSGTTIASLSTLAVNNATTFTTPDTNETALLIHEQDGSVKAFSNICTHRPYDLVYQANTQKIFCALHSANFDASTGAVLNGPPHTGLKSFRVQVDGQGNVVYSQS